MPKTSSKKKKKRLDNNAKYMALGIVLGCSVLVLAIAVPLTIIYSNQRPDLDDAPEVENQIPGLDTILARTEELEKSLYPTQKWQWNDLNSRRPWQSNNPATNGAINFKATFAANKNVLPKKSALKALEGAFPTQSPEVSLNMDQKATLNAMVAPVKSLLRDLYNLPPNGAFEILLTKQITDSQEQGQKLTVLRHPYELYTPQVRHVSIGAKLIYADALLNLDNGNIGGARLGFETIMKIAGYLRTEPVAQSQVERMNAHLIAMDLLERILARDASIPAAILENYQKILASEINYNDLAEAVRAERAAFDKTCDMARNKAQGFSFPRPPHKFLPIGLEAQQQQQQQPSGGDDMMPDYMDMPNQDPDAAAQEDEEDEDRDPAYPKGDSGSYGGGSGGGYGYGGPPPSTDGPPPLDLAHAWYLQYMNEVLVLARGDTSKLSSGIAKWNRESPLTPPKAQGFVPDCEKWAELYLKKLARMRCALVALAMERYRLQFNTWPSNLADLGKLANPNNNNSAFLASPPRDPYTNRDLIYRPGKNNEGVVIYSTGADQNDNQALFDGLNTYQAGSDIGFRLWNPNNRGK